MKKFISGLKKGFEQDGKMIGPLEVIFGVTCALAILPIVVVYLILARVIMNPIKLLVKKVWK